MCYLKIALSGSSTNSPKTPRKTGKGRGKVSRESNMLDATLPSPALNCLDLPCPEQRGIMQVQVTWYGEIALQRVLKEERSCFI